MCQDDVRRECGQLCSVFANAGAIAPSPADINPYVLPDAPARLLQSLQERPDPGLKIRIVRSSSQQHTDPPHAPVLLRARGEWPSSHCSAQKRDELAPLHVSPVRAMFHARPKG